METRSTQNKGADVHLHIVRLEISHLGKSLAEMQPTLQRLVSAQILTVMRSDFTNLHDIAECKIPDARMRRGRRV